jgi:hypothetical protein
MSSSCDRLLNPVLAAVSFFMGWLVSELIGQSCILLIVFNVYKVFHLMGSASCQFILSLLTLFILSSRSTSEQNELSKSLFFLLSHLYSRLVPACSIVVLTLDTFCCFLPYSPTLRLSLLCNLLDCNVLSARISVPKASILSS